MKCEKCNYRLRNRQRKKRIFESKQEKFIPAPDTKRHWWCT